MNALFTDDCDGILLMPEIDRVIVACEWALDFFRDAPQLAAKNRVCPCGIDADYWKPSGRPRTNTAVVYWKSGDEAFCEQVEQIARTCGLEPRRLRSQPGEHAHFSPDDYRRLLDEARVGMFLSTFETQGLALAEAWSMDVPTAVWDPRGIAEWRGRSFQSGSSAPYLTPATGRLWRTLDELEPVLRGAARRTIRVSSAGVGAGAHDRRDSRGGALRHHPERLGGPADVVQTFRSARYGRPEGLHYDGVQCPVSN